MTYSIIPPILVVMSLIGIILFLLRKSSAVARLEDDINVSREALPETGIVKKTFGRISGGNDSGPGLKHHSLLILEKLTRRFKVFFLKMENTFTSWNESIRNKRKSQMTEVGYPEGKEEDMKNILDRLQERNVEHQEPIQRSVPEERAMPEQAINVGVKMDKTDIQKEKSIRPMISEKVVRPKYKRIEIKDRLEKILIERIAANPKDTEAYERLGEYYFEIENYNHAKECFKQVIKLNPANSDAKMRMKKLERLLARR